MVMSYQMEVWFSVSSQRDGTRRNVMRIHHEAQALNSAAVEVFKATISPDKNRQVKAQTFFCHQHKIRATASSRG